MSPAQSKKGTKRPPDEEEAIAHSKNRQKLEKEKSKTKGVTLTLSGKYKAISCGISIGTFDTKVAAIHAFNWALGKTKEQLKQELQEIKEQAIQEKVAAGQKVTVSPGVVHYSGKYQASFKGLHLGTFDTKEDAIHAFNWALGKTKEQLKQELQEIKAAKEKQEQQAIQEKVAAGQRVTVSPGVLRTPSGKYQASLKRLHLGTFDTKEAAIHAFNLALGKTNEQHKAAKEEQKRVAAERVAEAKAKSVSIMAALALHKQEKVAKKAAERDVAHPLVDDFYSGVTMTKTSFATQEKGPGRNSIASGMGVEGSERLEILLDLGEYQKLRIDNPNALLELHDIQICTIAIPVAPIEHPRMRQLILRFRSSEVVSLQIKINFLFQFIITRGDTCIFYERIFTTCAVRTVLSSEIK